MRYGGYGSMGYGFLNVYCHSLVQMICRSLDYTLIRMVFTFSIIIRVSTSE